MIRNLLREPLPHFLLLGADLAAPAPPSDEELERFPEAHPDRFMAPARLTFTQIYLNADRRGPGALADAGQMLLALRDRGDDVDPAAFGDPTLIEPYHERASRREIARVFGARLADAVTPLGTRRWHGPMESGDGRHLVYVRAHESERLPPLEGVRERVRTEPVSERQRVGNEAFYEQLRKRYEAVVEKGGADEPGVARGQPAFVAGVLARGPAMRGLGALPRPAAEMAASYAIGAMAAFWTIERVVGFWA